MITDNGLRLATAETPAGDGVGGIGDDSATLALDLSGITQVIRNFNEIGAGEPVSLAFNVDASFDCATVGATIEFQLISLPILATLLEPVASGDGYQLFVDDAPTVIADDTVTIANHGLPLGTPIHITNQTTSTGLTDGRVYFAIPTTANEFQLGSNLTNALAGIPVDLLTLDGSVDVNFIPTIHASSGALPIYTTGDPSVMGPLDIGSRFHVPVRPLATITGDHRLPGGQTLQVPIGSGPPLTGASRKIAANTQRYYYLHYKASHTVTAGSITCDIVTCGADALNYPATGVEVVG